VAYSIKVGSSVRFFHHCLLDRLSLAALLGVTMGAWVQVERHLMFLYGYLMGLELHRSEGFFPPIHTVAKCLTHWTHFITEYACSRNWQAGGLRNSRISRSNFRIS
jgi:hypothetical protein